MTTFDTIRYGIALVLLVTGPGSVLFWFPIHPLATFWRRVGAGWAYLVGFGVYALSAVVLAAWRRPLLAVEFGTSRVTLAAGVVLIVAAAALRRTWHRQLKLRTLFGLPELSPERHPQSLLTEGAYARVRHPRYLEILLAFLGYALAANYLAGYAVALFLALSILVLIPMEERELAERYGAAYVEYRRRVPALLPRLRRGR